ncbi:MAG: ATP-binding protein [Gaiellaceae bacterium]
MRRLARLPIRLRLTLAFAVAMTVVLAALGLVLYLRMDSALDAATDRSLRARADDVVALVGDSGQGHLDRQGIAQVLDARGAIVDSTPDVAGRPLLSAAEVSRARGAGELMVDRSRLPGGDDPVRLLGVSAGDQVVVVGASLEPHEDALQSLLTQLLAAGPLLLLLSSAAAYLLAGRALRPVESMRREAEAVSVSEPGRRLPLPPADDEIAALGRTLNQMLERLEDALERERRFVTDASHELRTPLAALRTELELALRRKRSPEELEEALRSAAEETDRLSQLAEDLLVLARAEGGSLPVRREPLDAREILDDVRKRYARRAAESGRQLETEAAGEVHLSADRLRLEQALGNLVENALRHGRGRILLRADARNGLVGLHVQDEGAGFSDPFLERAFDPFTRDHAGRGSPGAGLGLAIVDLIARAHGGAARAANTGGGADVWIELPSRG